MKVLPSLLQTLVLSEYVLEATHAGKTDLPLMSDQALKEWTARKGNPLFALFTSDACTRCENVEKSLVNARSEILKDLLESGVDQSLVEEFDFVKLDLHNNTEAKEEFQVNGVPTLLLIKPSHVHEYGGPTSSQALSKWLKKRLIKTIEPLKDEQDAQHFRETHEVAVVLETDVKGAAAFETLVESLREIPVYGWLNTTATSPTFGRVRLYKRGLPQVLTHQYNTSEDATMLAWLYENQIPLFGEINLSNLHAYLHASRPFVWLVGSAADHTRYEKEISDLIMDEASGGKFWWVWLDPEGGEVNSRFIQDSLRPSRVPGWVITDYKGPGRFSLQEDFKRITKDTLQQWVSDVLADKIQRHLLSDPIPLEETDKVTGIEWAVTDNLLQKLQRKDRPSDIFLLIESMWCDDCPQLLRVEAQVSHALKAAELYGCMRLARIEAHSNEIDPEWDLFGASAYLFPIDETAPTKKVQEMTKIAFDQEITEENLIAFLQKHGKCKDLDKLKPSGVKVNVREEL